MAALVLTVLSVDAQISEVSISMQGVQKQNQRALVADGLRLSVPEGGTIDYCLPAAGVDSIASVAIEQCNTLQHGTLEVSSECFTYTHSGALGIDKICATTCDSSGNCQELEIFITAGVVLDLPFVDDFSYDGPYPDASKWLDQDIYVNYNLAERPLGLGVATFDGLDAGGSPYDRPEGVSDRLTSAFLRAAGADNVFVSFFFQPRGFGIKPRVRDSLSLDVKNPAGKWINIWASEGLPESITRFDPAPEFEFTRIQIADSLLSDALQLRFRNRSQQLGLQQIWHLDYVRVAADVGSEETFEDLAFQSRPNGVLAPYTAMPYRHFRDFESMHVADFYEVGLFSHFQTSVNADPSTFAVRDESEIVFVTDLLRVRETAADSVNQRTLAPGRHNFRNVHPAALRADLVSALASINPSSEQFEIATQYSFNQQNETEQGVSAYLRNNQTEFINVFDNYFAYDDGTAESGLKAENNNGIITIVQEYTLNVDDELQGVQFFFPRVEGDNEKLRFNLLIWLDSLAGDPDYVQESLQPLYADTFFDTIQGYTTYDLRDTAGNKISLDVNAGKFFVGWQQVTTTLPGDISVGLDKNRPDGTDFVFFRVNEGDWINVGESNSTINGALMIRPLMGDEEIFSTRVPLLRSSSLEVFPNPARDYLDFYHEEKSVDGWSYQIYGLQGKLLREGLLEPRIRIAGLNTGLYLLAVRDQQRQLVLREKLQIVR